MGVGVVWVQVYILTNVLFSDEELRAEVLLFDGLMIDDCQGANSGQHKVLSYFIREGFEGNEEDVRIADSRE